MAVNVGDEKERSWLDRRHPEYADYEEHWQFLYDSYLGGPKYHKEYLFQYWREDKGGWEDRIERAQRHNFSQRVVDIINGYLWQKPPSRMREDVEKIGKTILGFWDDADLFGNDIDTVMSAHASPMTATFGRIWAIVDKPRQAAPTLAAAIENRIHPYLSFVMPGDLLDAHVEMGRVLWALIRERTRDSIEPKDKSGAPMIEQFRLWLPNGWELYEIRDEGNKRVEVMIDSGVHTLGEVPIVPIDHKAAVSYFVSPSLIWELAYLDRAIFNHVSLLDEILHAVTFPQLAVPWQSLLIATGTDKAEGKQTKEQIVEQSISRVFTYDATGGGEPKWIAPPSDPADVLMKRIDAEINELYRLVALQGEMAVEITEASGVSREHEFRKLNKLLATMADNMESAETRMLRFAAKWENVDPKKLPDNAVDYPEEFDIKTLAAELEEAIKMNEAKLPPLVLAEKQKAIVLREFSKMDEVTQKKLTAAIEAHASRMEEMEQATLEERQKMAKAPTP